MSQERIQVNLEFNANTQKAKQQMRDLQKSLTSIINATNQPGGFAMTPEIEKAQTAAMQLKIALDSATNVDTGKLNLNKFQNQLKQSGMSLKDYARQLSKLGPSGVDAFTQVARAMANADTRLFQLSGTLKKFTDTLFGNLRWQMAGGAINMVTQAISSAVSYAKELDKSLTDIQIVTGKSTQSMAKFAKEANTAAKQLGATTKEYADASLIFFQQGLSGAAVKERTEATMKLANVTGRSAQEVSDYMTAIWNNFDDGSKSLEYYADVITKLGAATASSTDEIAQGLEKFASVAETVGLSYEYATAALATVTAETRQSADVVGTAFKTIFARMENLSLGETLEDGTDLGKYSRALATIGVDIKSANGELKDMDQILEETGTRWGTLTKDQQVALAQSVAGVRQYTQFVALMDNWDVMQNNIEMAADATGELNKQQEIYMNSTEAAEKQMKASGEALKNSFIDGGDLETVYKGLSKILDAAGWLLETVGGLKGALFLVASALTKIYQTKIGDFFTHAGTTITDAFGSVWRGAQNTVIGIRNIGKAWKKEELLEFKQGPVDPRQEAIQEASQMAANNAGGPVESELLKENFATELAIQESAENMSPLMQQRIRWQKELLEARQEELIKSQQQLEMDQEINDELALRLQSQKIDTDPIQETGQAIGSAEASVEDVQKTFQDIKGGVGDTKDPEFRQEVVDGATAEVENIKTQFEALGIVVDEDMFAGIDASLQEFLESGTGIDTLLEKIKLLKNEIAVQGEAKLNESVDAAATAAGQGVVEYDEEGADRILSHVENNFGAKGVSSTAAQLATFGQSDGLTEGEKSEIQQLAAEGQEMTGLDAERQQHEAKLQMWAEEQATYQALQESYASDGNDKAAKEAAEEIARITEEINKEKQAIQGIDKRVADYNKRVTKTVSGIKKERNERKRTREELKRYGQQEQKNGKTEKKNEKERKKITKGYSNMRKEIGKNNKQLKSYGQYLGQIVGGATQFVSGFTMMSNAIEGLSHKISSGKASWKDYLSAAMSLLMALPQMVNGAKSLSSAFGGVTQKLGESLTKFSESRQAAKNKAQADKEAAAAGKDLKDSNDQLTDSEQELEGALRGSEGAQQGVNKSREQSKPAADVAAEAADKEAKAEKKALPSKIATIAGNLGKLFSKGPPGWVMGAISTALVAVPLIWGGISALSAGSASGGQEEAIEEADEEIETADTNLDLIHENQELSGSIQDLTQDYKDLKASGENAMDTFAEMIDQIPELIDNYKELENSLNIDLNTPKLQQAFETFKLTGDTTAWEEAQAEADYKVTQAQHQQASNKLSGATRKMIQEARDSDSGKLKDGKTFAIDMRGGAWNGAEVRQYLEKYDTEQNGILNINMNDPKEVLQAYEDMQNAVNEMEAAGINPDDEALVALKENLSLMAESAGIAQEALDELFTVAEQGFNDMGQASLIMSGKGVDGSDLKGVDGAIDNLTEYEKARSEILTHLSKQYGITEEQAEKLLATSDKFKAYEMALNQFADGGAIDLALEWSGWSGGAQNAQFLKWYESLSEEDKVLALNIDFTGVEDIADLNEALTEQHELMLENQAVQKAVDLGVTEEDFQTYTDILVDCNEHLDENNALTKQVAAAQIGLNNGLSSLKDGWDDIAKVLSKGERNTLDYAEAIGKIKKSMEQAFGYKPSTSFVESHLEEIQDLINGNTEGFEELQKLMAEDAVKNITFNTKDINENIAVVESDIQNALNQLINDLDTSLEVGQGSTISGDYLKTLQDALDSGQMTMDQLNSIMSTAGFQLEITDWKTIDGPKKTIATWDSDEEGNPIGEVKYTTTQEKIQVPVINNDASGISGGGSAPVVRSVDETSVSSMSTKKDEGGEQEQKKLEDEVERYHEIERELASLERQYDRISRAKDQAFGNKRLALIRQENKLIHEQIDALEREKAEAEDYYAQDRAALDKYGVSFGANGEITNYDEVYAAQIAQYNSDPEAYETSYTEFTEAMSKYEESLDKIEELKDQIDEKMIEEINNRMEEVSYEVELQVSLNEDSMALIEFQLEGLTDSAQDVAEKFALMGKQMAAQISNAETYKQGIIDTLGITDIDFESIMADPSAMEAMLQGKELTAEQVEQLREYRDGLIESATAMREYRDSISDNLVAAFEEANIEMEKFGAELEHTTAMIEGYRNILDLAGRDALGINDQLFSAMAKTQYSVANNSVSVAKSKMEQDMASLKAIEEAMDKARREGDEAGLKELEEAYDEIYATVQEDQQNLLDTTSTALEQATAVFEEEMNGIMRTFENAMSGDYGNHNQLTASLEREKKLSDLYLDDYKQIYELAKLTRNIEKSIDANDSLAAKAKLRDIQEEINDLQEDGVQLTQYEVNELKAKYDLRLAEIALEEAQNAKSQVRMQRDSEGNWGYVYTANQQQIAAAEQAYEDKLYAYQNLTQQRTDELISKMTAIPREFAEAVQSIYEDQTLSDEERALAISEIQQYYADMYQYAVDQMRVVNEHAANLYEQDWNNYAQSTGYKISQNEDWIDNFNETTYAQKLGYDDVSDAQQNFLSSSGTMLNDLHGKYQDYRTNVKETLDLAIDDLDAFIGSDGTDGTLAGYLEQARQQSERVAEKAEETAERNADAFEDTVNEASDWLSQYSGLVDDWNYETSTIASTVNDLIFTYGSLEDALGDVADGYREVAREAQAALAATGGGSYNVSNISSGVQDNKPSTSNNNKNTTTAKPVDKDPPFEAGDQAKIQLSYFDNDTAIGSYGALNSYPHKHATGFGWNFHAYTLAAASLKNGSTVTLDYSVTGTDGNKWWHFKEGVGKGDGGGDMYIMEGELTSLDTGGYTGEWDSSGRLAMLHQKEIILNAHDTENFLAGINILRDITAAIDLQAAQHRLALSNLHASMGIDTQHQELEQHIVIHADFPAVRERTEIEAAFDSLLNRASQFAYRKK